MDNSIIAQTIVDNYVENVTKSVKVKKLLSIPNEALLNLSSSSGYERKVLEEMSSKTINNMNEQRIEVTIQQLNSDFIEIANNKLEINSLFISGLHLDLESSGFNGYLDISLPYSQSVPKEYGFLFENLPLEIIIKITQNYQMKANIVNKTLPPSENESITIKALTLMSNNSVKHIYRNENILDNKYFSKLQFKFTDFLKSTWSDSYLVAVYTKTSYTSLIRKLNETFNSIVNINISNSVTELSEEKPFIAINADVLDNYSLYDFLISTLQSYGISLIYDYSNNEYIIDSAKTWLNEANSSKIEDFDFIHMSELNVYNSRPLKELSIKNLNINGSSQTTVSPSINSKWNQQSQTYSAIETAILTTPSLEEQSNTIQKAKLNQLRHNDNAPLVMKLEVGTLYSCPLFPNYKISFDNTEISKITNKQISYPTFLSTRVKISIYPSLLWEAIKKRDKITFTKLDYNNDSDITVTQFNKDQLTTSGCIIFENRISYEFNFAEDVSILLPKNIKMQKPIISTANVYTSSEDSNNNSENHLIYNINSNSSTSISQSSDDNANYCLGDNYSPHILSYMLELPKTLSSTPSGELLVPMSIYESNFTPNNYLLLKSGTFVKINIHQEHTALRGILTYYSTQPFFNGKETQSSSICFGGSVNSSSELESGIEHQHDLQGQTANLLIKSSLKNNERSINLSSDALQIKYLLDK